MKKLALTLSVVATLSSPAMAQGDAEAGKAKAAVCSACHGVDGNSLIEMYPKVAGQHAAYLAKQLHDFKTAMTTGGQKGRMDPIMGGMAMPLSDQDILDISAFYAKQQPTNVATAVASDLGEKLYKGGDISRGITACIACHGPSGKGMEAAGFPMLAGQHAAYTSAQLTKFHDAKRGNDMNGMMRDIAKKLNQNDIQALSQYIATLK
ncbi:cytochrome c [Shewanella sp. NFH-SH190041]|uniref:c-type cytochrome n=1 Tax=Shewanella sp. NFH-SH190041 TaxID=2950245 RepID=UPI0021C48558|nr:cytochrome c4 [Shewanella sp. NFH-SH190041]BDM62750.1 cytochrome c [Shewanella sp. NFH-SH190041]